MSKVRFHSGLFSAFTLKVLACVFMLCDHIGVMIFPDVVVLRYIGRLAFPIFAYFIAEGCRYTKNKLRRFLSVFILGVMCELFYVLFTGAYYGNILLTFCFSILLIYLLDCVKISFEKRGARAFLMLFFFLTMIVATYFYCEYIGLDYGFFGVMTPVFVVAFDNIGEWSDKLYSKINRKAVSLFMFSIPLLMIALCWSSSDYQILSILGVVLLCFYNGERGKYSFKYGFYLFYPLHLVVLQGICFVLNNTI